MASFVFKIFVFIFSLSSLFSTTINTFYGALEVEEPVLLELIESPSFQRLKYIHQYGVSYYTTHKENYTRYEHSLGVFAILRLKNASLEEQVAGLLHDVSHTIFSHVGDWIFHKESEEKDYQNSIHADFLNKYGLAQILKKHNLTVEQIMPLEDLFPMLEQKGSCLCADRIEYNIQGAYLKGFITKEEALKIIKSLQFTDNCWVSNNQDLMTKIAQFSLFMTEESWGNKTEYLLSSWLAEALLRSLDIGYISYEDIHFGIDDLIWDKLINSNDSKIQHCMRMISCPESYYLVSDYFDADMVIKSKFRGINPIILTREGKAPLRELDPSFCKKYDKVQSDLKKGWPIKFIKKQNCN